MTTIFLCFTTKQCGVLTILLNMIRFRKFFRFFRHYVSMLIIGKTLGGNPIYSNISLSHAKTGKRLTLLQSTQMVVLKPSTAQNAMDGKN